MQLRTLCFILPAVVAPLLVGQVPPSSPPAQLNSRDQVGRLAEMVSAREFGAKGDGVADDTAAIQSALNHFGWPNNRSGKIVVPSGAYKISKPLFYRGAPGTGITIECEEGKTRGPTGTRLLWYGPPDLPAVWFLGANESLIDNCEVEAVEPMRTGIWVDATSSSTPATVVVTSVERSGGIVTVHTRSQHPFVSGSTLSLSGVADQSFNEEGLKVLDIPNPESFTFSQIGSPAKSSGGTAKQIVSAGSSGVVLQRVTVARPSGTNSAAVRISHRLSTDHGTTQVSELYIRDSVLTGNWAARNSTFGIAVDNAGNTKNIFVEDTDLHGFDYGVNTEANGSFTMTNCIFHNFIADIRTGPGLTTLLGGESESVGKFVTGSTGANPGTVTVIGFSWEGTAPDPSDVIADFAGNYVFIGSRFYNLRDYPHSVPKIRVGDPFMSGNDNSGVYSIGNYYQAARHYPPFVGADTASFLLDPASPLHGPQSLNITSIDDSGGIGGTMVKLPSVAHLDSLGIDSVTMLKPQTPASSNAACSTGELMWDANYIYICAAGGPEGKAVWKRALLASF